MTYQAVTIIRNKIRGTACDKLTGHGTVINCNAIIARLDKEYGDKRPLHLLEQELCTLRQGNMTVNEYYDQVQLKLTALTNKTLLNYNNDFGRQLTDKYRKEALRVFISGLKRHLSDVLFSSRPDDLPTALALAEELEGNRSRFNLASSFNPEMVRETAFVKPSKPTFPRPLPLKTVEQDRCPEPMDVDRSLRSRFSRQSLGSKQNINNLNSSEDLAHNEAANKSYEEQCEEEYASICLQIVRRENT